MQKTEYLDIFVMKYKAKASNELLIIHSIKEAFMVFYSPNVLEESHEAS